VQIENKYCILGGSTKCGTTSVFNYFEFHPEICPCKMKESRYFLETNYKLVAKQRTSGKYQNFNELFNNCKPGSVLLEATPDYLYSNTAADKIKSEIPGCKIIFILREPVSRLESWYRFALLNGLIKQQTSFEDYIGQQKNYQDDAPQHLRSLEQGRYSGYLEYYFQLFGKDNIHVCFYEDLVADSKKFCAAICDFTGINNRYFDNYNFKIYNKTVAARNVGAHLLFRKFKRTVRPAVKLLPDGLRKRLKLAGYNLEKTYSNINTDKTDPSVELNNEMKSFLEEYYNPSNKHLEKLTGLALPWKY